MKNFNRKHQVNAFYESIERRYQLSSKSTIAEVWCKTSNKNSFKARLLPSFSVANILDSEDFLIKNRNSQIGFLCSVEKVEPQALRQGKTFGRYKA